MSQQKHSVRPCQVEMQFSPLTSSQLTRLAREAAAQRRLQTREELQIAFTQTMEVTGEEAALQTREEINQGTSEKKRKKTKKSRTDRTPIRERLRSRTPPPSPAPHGPTSRGRQISA